MGGDRAVLSLRAVSPRDRRKRATFAWRAPALRGQAGRLSAPVAGGKGPRLPGEPLCSGARPGWKVSLVHAAEAGSACFLGGAWWERGPGGALSPSRLCSTPCRLSHGRGLCPLAACSPAQCLSSVSLCRVRYALSLKAWAVPLERRNRKVIRLG